MDFTDSRVTEQPSIYNDLEKMPLGEVLQGINNEDKKVAVAVEKALPQVEALVAHVVERMRQGGRLFYIGAGTSGRLGILDASECPPTFGVSPDMVIGIIAGGDKAIRSAVENAEDDYNQAWADLQAFNINEKDFLVGIAASGSTPYVIGGLNKARENGLGTGCVVCNAGSKVAAACEYPVEVVAGPEFLTGSTRMKSGTAQKMVLNMITTASMIQLGRVKGNRMVDMQLSNEKLVNRGAKMIMEQLHVSLEEATRLLLEKGSVRAVIDAAGRLA